MGQRALTYGLTQLPSNLQIAWCGGIEFHRSILYCLHSSHTAQMPHSLTSTEALQPSSVLAHVLPFCGWRNRSTICTVKGMHSSTTNQSWNTLPLPAGAPVQTLHIRTGQSLWLQAQSGIVWLTCEGQLADSFLRPGQSLRMSGPARLHLGAYGSQNAQLRWSDATSTALSAMGTAAATVPA